MVFSIFFFQSENMSKVDSPHGSPHADLSPNSKEASFLEKENEDPNSMKQLQRELNEIASQKYALAMLPI